MTTEEIINSLATDAQCMKFAVSCAMLSCTDPMFAAWALRWLTGKDRTEESAKEIEKELSEQAGLTKGLGREGWALWGAAAAAGSTWRKREGDARAYARAALVGASFGYKGKFSDFEKLAKEVGKI